MKRNNLTLAVLYNSGNSLEVFSTQLINKKCSDLMPATHCAEIDSTLVFGPSLTRQSCTQPIKTQLQNQNNTKLLFINMADETVNNDNIFRQAGSFSKKRVDYLGF